MPLFRTAAESTIRNLVPVLGLTLGLQLASAAVFVPLQSEVYYDFIGSIGFISSTAFSLALPSIRAGKFIPVHPRQIILSSLVAVWAVRLSSLLLPRAIKNGGDSRFEEIKKSPSKFTVAWVGQAAWIGLTALPVFVLNSVPAGAHPALGLRDFIGLSIWAAGFTAECVADNQKSAWRKERDEKKHEEKFISRGLWAWSRHPNMFSEIVLWSGIALASTSVLGSKASKLGRWSILAAVASPLFEFALIRFASGVPPLEESADKKFGGDEKYEKYKKNVPVFVPTGQHLTEEL